MIRFIFYFIYLVYENNVQILTFAKKKAHYSLRFHTRGGINMPRQIWCSDGHYFQIKLSPFSALRGVTNRGMSCLIEGCEYKIAVSNYFEDTDKVAEYGYIIPIETEKSSLLQCNALRKQAARLRKEADELENRANAIKLCTIPNIETDRTKVPKGKEYWEWYRTGRPSLDNFRIPIDDMIE